MIGPDLHEAEEGSILGRRDVVCIPQICSGFISRTNTYNSQHGTSLTELFSEIDHVLLVGEDLRELLSSLRPGVHFFKDLKDTTIIDIALPLIFQASARRLGTTEWLFASDDDAELLIPKLVSRGMRVVLVRGIGHQNQTLQPTFAEQYGVYVIESESPRIKQEIQDTIQRALDEAIAMQSVGNTQAMEQHLLEGLIRSTLKGGGSAGGRRQN